MTVVTRFNTSMFDVTRERPNPINPIPGESVLLWLKAKLAPTYELSEPDAEDWGWYANMRFNGSNYMIGASASEPEGELREWVIQVVRSRSLKERLLGRGNATPDDPCVIHVLRLLSAEPRFQGVQVEGAA